MTKYLKMINLCLVSLTLGVAGSVIAAPNATQTSTPSALKASHELNQYTQVARHDRRHRMSIHVGSHGGFHHRSRHHRYYRHHTGPFVGVHYGFRGSPYYYHNRNWYWVNHGVIPLTAWVVHTSGSHVYYGCLAKYRGTWYQGRARSGGPCMIYYKGRRIALHRYMVTTR